MTTTPDPEFSWVDPVWTKASCGTCGANVGEVCRRTDVYWQPPTCSRPHAARIRLLVARELISEHEVGTYPYLTFRGQI